MKYQAKYRNMEKEKSKLEYGKYVMEYGEVNYDRGVGRKV